MRNDLSLYFQFLISEVSKEVVAQEAIIEGGGQATMTELVLELVLHK